MKDFVEIIREVEKETSKNKGEYELFALFLRENSSNKWDILVSADWIILDKLKALRYLAKKIKQKLEHKDLTKISRIVIIEEDNPALLALQNAIKVEHGKTEIKDSNFFGLQIKHAYIFTSKRKEPVA